MRLAEKVAIVTGSTQGIGKATAELFAAQGAKVIVNSHEPEAGASIVRDIRAAGGHAIFVQADVSVESAVAGLVSRAVEEFGRLDVMVQNAYWNCLVTAVDMDEQQWTRTLDVSLKSVWLGAKYGIPEMMKVGGGAIVNVSSVNSLVANPSFAAYAAAKGGVNSLTRQLAVDYGRFGVRVNAIAPGLIMVERFRQMLLDDSVEYRHALDCYPIGRLGTPEDIAQAALYLASDEAGFVTGTTLVVDGGHTAQSPEALVRPFFRRRWRDDALVFADDADRGAS